MCTGFIVCIYALAFLCLCLIRYTCIVIYNPSQVLFCIDYWQFILGAPEARWKKVHCQQHQTRHVYNIKTIIQH
jgi:hypothetical protein